MTPEQREAVEAVRKACRCLYLEVHAHVADDVKAKAEAVITAYDALLREQQTTAADRDALQQRVAELEKALRAVLPFAEASDENSQVDRERQQQAIQTATALLRDAGARRRG